MLFYWLMGRMFEEDKGAEGGGGGGGGGPAAGAQGGQGATGAAGGAQGGKPGDVDPKGPQKHAAGAAGGGQGGAAPAKPKAPATEPDDDGDEDEDADPKADEQGMLSPMSLKAFRRRVGRSTKKALREMFGTDDKEAIIAGWRELPNLRKYKDAAEAEKLSEREKLEKRAKDAEEAAAKVREEAEATVTAAGVREYNGKLKAHLAGLVDKADIPDMLDKLGRAVAKDEVKSLKGARRWLSTFVKEHPKWAKTEGAAAADDKSKDADKDKPAAGAAGDKDKGKDADKDKPAPSAPRRRIPLTTAARPGKPAAPGAAPVNADTIDYRTASRAEIERVSGWKI